MMRDDDVGVAVTPSRRTDAAVTRVLAETLAPLGGQVWDGSGENPYFGMLALADAIVVTVDSVSMVSEAVATAAPVMLARLPGRSRRNALFTEGLLRDGRVREFNGRLELWPVTPLDDTAEAAAEMCRRLGLPHPDAPC
jgi:mitochondrial fission protein ELM1